MDQWARAQIEALQLRVAALEQKIAGAGAGAPVAAEAAPEPEPEVDPEVDPEVVALVRQGKGLQAIHAYINKTGSDLATAKAAVARIAASLNPEDFAT